MPGQLLEEENDHLLLLMFYFQLELVLMYQDNFLQVNVNKIKRYAVLKRTC